MLEFVNIKNKTKKRERERERERENNESKFIFPNRSEASMFHMDSSVYEEVDCLLTFPKKYWPIMKTDLHPSIRNKMS